MGRTPKIKRGGLSNEEKGRVVSLLHTLGDSPETYQKIAEDLGRPIDSVKRAIKDIKNIFVDTSKEEEFFLVKKSVIQRVRLNLIQSGMNKFAVDGKIKKVISGLNEEQQKTITEAQLFQACLRLMSAGDTMITESAGGREGVTIMTPASAEKADNINKNSPPQHPAVFKLS